MIRGERALLVAGREDFHSADSEKGTFPLMPLAMAESRFGPKG